MIVNKKDKSIKFNKVLIASLIWLFVSLIVTMFPLNIKYVFYVDISILLSLATVLVIAFVINK